MMSRGSLVSYKAFFAGIKPGSRIQIDMHPGIRTFADGRRVIVKFEHLSDPSRLDFGRNNTFVLVKGRLCQLGFVREAEKAVMHLSIHRDDPAKTRSSFITTMFLSAPGIDEFQLAHIPAHFFPDDNVEAVNLATTDDRRIGRWSLPLVSEGHAKQIFQDVLARGGVALLP